MPEPDGFEQFVSERSAALTRYGYVLAGNPHDAADLVQEALIRLRGAWGRVRRRDDPEAYVRTTMARLHISWWRKRRRERLVDTVPELWAIDPGITRAEEDIGVWDALGSVPPRQRAVLVLRYYEGLGDNVIAERLRISEGTVRSQALRGLRTLREHLEGPRGPLAPDPAGPDILTTERRRHA
ncbi:SigE family RNA polymerase sigma factor [Cryptosporangium sp. NPDC051539]|uniref:SigE family RNA polymerase sigma factor n=1 Tax=Cryptosporangium sp. NPDC051539 TaxID=3363962 RepID=UPI00378E2D8A